MIQPRKELADTSELKDEIQGVSPRGVPTDRLPRVLDLDGTLSRVDTLHEQVVRIALRRPLALLAAIPALFRSREAFKARLAAVPFSSSPHPVWNSAVLESAARSRRGNVIVCTASHAEYARELVRPIGGISEVHGSSSALNLRGEAKAQFLQTKYGHRGFVYYGNDETDIPVWKHAAKAYVVSDDPAMTEKARAVCPEVETIPVSRPAFLISLLKALRPHQWTKNLLVLVPILTSHRFGEWQVVLQGLIAFAIFCALSSAVYLVNDLFDLDADRQHPTKSRRPFAAGDLSVLWGLPVAAALTGAALAGAWFLNAGFALVSAAYLALAVVYSAQLKKLVLLDVFSLASLYTLRLVAGGAVTGIPISVWLAAFSIFIFLSLALCKRYAELLDLPVDSARKLNRRGYSRGDVPYVLAQGLIYMGCATLVLAVYLSSDAVTLLYKNPSVLWGAVMIVSYWGSRLWLLTSRGQMHDDPVLFALKDKTSWACLLLLLAVFVTAMSLS